MSWNPYKKGFVSGGSSGGGVCFGQDKVLGVWTWIGFGWQCEDPGEFLWGVLV